MYDQKNNLSQALVFTLHQVESINYGTKHNPPEQKALYKVSSKGDRRFIVLHRQYLRNRKKVKLARPTPQAAEESQ